uniref:ATP-binding protein n=1 Tax=Nocardia mikamii TaxID=508464 RepID=UPI000A605C50
MAELSFNTLRTWNGEQSRAFEELSYQLLKDQVPTGTHAIRTGNPDGGVEWYATLPDGTEWGWQAKHVSGIDALLTAMTDSVKRVAKERTDLRKLTFAISWNLSTGTSGGERKSQRQKYLDKVGTWKKEIKGADKIEFCLKQESDLLDELAKPEHRGRRWFWWDQVVLGSDWLKERYREQVDAATEKYRPDLQIDIPIQDDLLALGFDQSIVDAFDHLRRSIASNAAHVDLWSKHEDEAITSKVSSLRDASGRLRAVAELLDLQAGDDNATLGPLLLEMEKFRADFILLYEHLQQADQQWRDLPKEEQSEVKKPSELISLRGAYKLRAAIDDLDYWLKSTTGRSFLNRAYFLTGQAGAGKTHLLLDATRRALDADRPAVFLAGAQFGRGDLWISIADQLGLPAHGSDVLLNAMDTAGEAASTTGRRFVVFIDALNDTTPPDFWRTSLPRLRAAISRYPHVALAVSCRDTYREVVCDDIESSRYVNQQHPGFAEREVEAAQRYFDHYHLEAPKIPLLTPEFTLPLFLRLYCESLASTDSPPPLAGHQGRIEIFERYLNAKVSTVSRRLRPTATSGYELSSARSQVIQVLDAILDELSRVGQEAMSLAAVEPVVRAVVQESSDDPIRILGLLQEEGVLTREKMYLGDGNFEEGIRIVFQAFSDFLLLKRRVALSADPLHDLQLREWLGSECSFGIREAATVFFPEEYKVELPDLLGLQMRSDPDDDDADDGIDWRVRWVYSTLVETLPYRRSEAITQRTIDLLNDAQLCITRAELYRALFILAPQPGNRLNAFGLHKYLTDRRMPERDSDFGIATYDELMDAFGPVARLARWAAAGPYLSYSAEVVELAAIPLCWLLSSPNRFMRDWVTKALVQLLHGH